MSSPLPKNKVIRCEASTHTEASRLLQGMLDASRPKPEWIKCADRLPTASDADFEEQVWVFCSLKYQAENPYAYRMNWKYMREHPEYYAWWQPTGRRRPDAPDAEGTP